MASKCKTRHRENGKSNGHITIMKPHHNGNHQSVAESVNDQQNQTNQQNTANFLAKGVMLLLAAVCIIPMITASLGLSTAQASMDVCH